jgi:hypothetical protein
VLEAATPGATSTLTTVSDWVTIIAGGAALLAAAWGVIRWTWRYSRADDIALGLDVGGWKIDGVESGLKVGMTLTNRLARPLSCAVEFQGEIAGASPNDASWSQPRTDGEGLWALGPSQAEGWYSPWVGLGQGAWPVQITATYRVRYGSLGGKMRRVLTGSVKTSRFDVPGSGGESWYFDVVARRDERLPRRERVRLT